MQSKALVTTLAGNRAEILVMRSEACGSCSACNLCHTKPAMHWVDNPLQAKAGDYVIVEMKNGTFLKNIAWLYILPLVLFVGTMYLTQVLLGQMGVFNELYNLLGGFFGLFLFWVLIRLVNKKKEGEEMMTMVRLADLKEVLPQGSCASSR